MVLSQVAVKYVKKDKETGWIQVEHGYNNFVSVNKTLFHVMFIKRRFYLIATTETTVVLSMMMMCIVDFTRNFCAQS